MMRTRRYPIGIQTFSRIIREGYVYVDKTDLVWQLAHYSTFIFLSRPRRFGKSLLSSTLHSYFDGDKALFDGLKIMHLEQEWKQYPVIHLDLSEAKGLRSPEKLNEKLYLLLKPYTRLYGADPDEKTPGSVISGLIRRIYQQTGTQAVVIIDEYDAPLLDTLHEQDKIDEYRLTMQEFYQPLKANEAFIKFCFITGITKFSQLSIFSTINNIKNVTLLPRFSAICGITEEEVCTCLKPDITAMAEDMGLSPDAMFQKIKARYDGYHFSELSADIYNPYSLFNALADRKLANYWFSTGTPSFLIRQMQHFQTDITAMEQLEVPASTFDQPTEDMTTALPLLYQSGYLTIKRYDPELESYTLAIPNQEVRIGYTEGLLPAYTGLQGGDVQIGFAAKLWQALKRDDIELAMTEMKAFLAGVPYVEGFKKKLAEAATAEGFYEYTLYLIFTMLNVYVRTQVKCSRGRADIVIWMSHAIYVMELKINGSAAEALQQIDNRGYARPYETDGRKIVKVGIRFSPETMSIDEWAVE